MPVKIAVPGVTGRMGQALALAALACPKATLCEVTARSGHPWYQQPLAKFLNHPALSPRLQITPHFTDACEVVVDFTLPAAVMAHLDMALNASLPMVIGATGFDSHQLQAIEAAARNLPIVLAPNTSLGINLLRRVLQQAVARLGLDWDLAVSESHHRHKLDAPSGTAKLLVETLAQAGDRPVACTSIRAGEIFGEHQVLLAGPHETLTFTHRAASRQTFASGAIQAALWLVQQPPGLYAMTDVLGLPD